MCESRRFHLRTRKKSERERERDSAVKSNYNECIIGVYYRAEEKQTEEKLNKNPHKVSKVDVNESKTFEYLAINLNFFSSEKKVEIKEAIELKTSEVKVFGSAAPAEKKHTYSKFHLTYKKPFHGYFLPKVVRLCRSLSRCVYTR